MSRLGVRTAWLRVLKNSECSDNARTKALRSLNPPAGLVLLRTLLADKTTPPKLLFALTEAYTEALERQPKRPNPEPESQPTKLPEPKPERKPLSAEEIRDLLG
jgi:hypothetical protein